MLDPRNPHQPVDLERIVRPLLAELARDTGMQSVYLTDIDWRTARQSIMFAHNAGKDLVTEGFTYPWSAALCRRALVDGPPYTSDALGDWPEAEHARVLDLRTFISIPVYTDRRPRALLGTLCALSSDPVVLGPATRRRMRDVALRIGQRLPPALADDAADDDGAEMRSLGEDLARAIAVIDAQRQQLELLTAAQAERVQQIA